ncbi:hypothetical protein L207DRAFT_514942 [Hyaloscypha variabilis F]|uniref:Uncharacterized protein n=1 Tax=Hyaloscypha variabilis (strain UAMH 11265 / GT02V1 / F) TaxID=1149755 RepID=A0A2J6RGY7_HYAVF|nr:hypothetical protein L207DRAFT_514942 [Hyaloscypha variabilis F]
MMASTRLSWTYVLLTLLGVVVALPEPGKLQLTKQSRLAILFAEQQFRGNYFTIEGIYGSCYDVLKEGEFRSITLEDLTEKCDVWGVPGCGEDRDGKDKAHAVYHPTPRLSWPTTRDGIVRDLGGVKSIRCFEKNELDKFITLQGKKRE